MRKLQIADSGVMQLAIREEIDRSEEARYDHRLHGLLLVSGRRSCNEVGALLGEAATTVQRWVRRLNPETAVVIAAKQRRSSAGAAFRAILATAEQFQTGDRLPLKLFSRDSDLVRLAAVNCGF